MENKNVCMQIQSEIMDYIDRRLPSDRLEQFVDHVNTCPDCREELNVYYTLCAGLRQLDREDDSMDELKNLDQALDADIRDAERTIRGVHFLKGLCYSIYTVAFWCIVAALAVQLRIFADMGIL